MASLPPSTRRLAPGAPPRPGDRSGWGAGTPPPGWLFVSSARPSLRVPALWGNEAPQVSGGPRWSIHERPGRVSITTYDGQDPYRMRLPIQLEGWVDERDQAPFLRNLRRMERPATTGASDPPGVLVRGARGAIGPDLTWVIESLEEGDELTRGGLLLRKAVTVNLLELVHDERLELRSEANIARESREASAARRYTVRRGDTLGGIAARELGSHKRAKDIARLNGIRDLTAGLKPGTVIRIPAR